MVSNTTTIRQLKGGQVALSFTERAPGLKPEVIDGGIWSHRKPGELELDSEVFGPYSGIIFVPVTRGKSK